MKISARFALLISLFVFCAAPTPSSPTPPVLEDKWLNGSYGYARALELQKELGVPLVVYFYADWCPYCRSLDSQYLNAAPMRDYLSRVVKVRINPDHGRPERELARSYGVTGYPTFLVMRSAASTPKNIQPFRLGGANLTPAQLANACREAAPVSSRGAAARIGNRSSEGPTELAAPALSKTSSQQGKLQVTTVAAAATESPEFISDSVLPTLDQVLERYVVAVGGKAAQMRITSRVAKGKVDVVGISNGGRLEMYATAPNKSLLVMNIDRIGLMRQGYDGRNGWDQSDESGVRASSGVALDSLARDAEFYRDLKLKELYVKSRLLGKIKYGYREAYLVEGTPRTGNPELLYFDVQGGLLIRRDVVRQTSKGLVRAQIYLSDWREVDGVKIPFKTTQTMPTVTFVFTLEQVKHNVPIDETIFRPPAK